MKAMKKSLTMFLVAVLIIVSVPFHKAETVNAAEPLNHLIINQVYGGGGKGDTPITNSFIELYNPTQEDVSLNGYSIVCGTDTLSLSANDIGTLKPGMSYLVVCKAEETTDQYLTYDLPTPDQTWEYAINNKDYTISLMKGEVAVDVAVADQKEAALKISKQKSLRRRNYQDTDDVSDWEIVVWEKVSVTVDQAYVDQYAPRNSKGEKGSVHGVSQEPVYTPVEASNTKRKGFDNGNSSLDMDQLGRYNSGALCSDGGSLEIVDYNQSNGYAYAVSGLKGKVIAVPLSQVATMETVVELPGTEYDVRELVAGKEGFVYGDITSVAVSPDGKKLAAAVQHADYDKNGMVALFDCNADGSLTNPIYVETGVQPDMVVFADADIILTADEGEPRMGYGDGCVDPKGTVSIIDVKNGTSVQADFSSFTAEGLTDENIILGKATADGSVIAPEYDLEPEYIAVSSDEKKAYVSLQEANAIGVLDIGQKQFTGVYSVGFEDYSQFAVDLVEDGKYEAATYRNLVGARMPDGIALYEKNGKTYLVTANEGDAREWGKYKNEAKTKDFTGENIRILDSTLCAGLPEGKSVMFGGRGFSIMEVTAEGLKEVYDSENDFEKITGEKIPDYFNCSNDDTKADSRSTKKGPEPENVTVGVVNGKTYAFVAVERIGGIMVYDITNPAQSAYVNYINSREFDADIKGDVSPEGLCFVENSKTGNPILLAACEVSGTLAVYELKANSKSEEENKQPETGDKPAQKPEEGGNQKPGGDAGQTPGEGAVPQENTQAVTVGTLYTDQDTKAQYEITSASKENPTVQYKKTTSKTAKKLEIPSTVKIDGVSYKVTEVAANAFLNQKKVEEIKVGKNVTVIGAKAFKGCKKLAKITLSSKTTKIGSNAFEGCKSLVSVIIPAKVTSIGANVFKGCSKLKTVTVKSSKLAKKNLGKNAFKGVPSKATVKVPKSKVSSYTKIFRERGLNKQVSVKKY